MPCRDEIKAQKGQVLSFLLAMPIEILVWFAMYIMFVCLHCGMLRESSFEVHVPGTSEAVVVCCVMNVYTWHVLIC